MTEDHVYVIGPRGGSVVKIGRSVDPKKRVTEIQLMSPLPLDVLWSHSGGHLEAKLHGRFAHLRTHGEWFDFGDDDPVEAVRAAFEEEARAVVKPVVIVPRDGAPLPDCGVCGHGAHPKRRCPVAGSDEWLDCQCQKYAA